jgi:hypothetical protein
VNRRLRLALLLSLVALSGCAPAPLVGGPVVAPLPPSEEGFVTPNAALALREVERAFAASRAYGELIWPGFRLHEWPLLLFDAAGNGWLVGAPFAPEGTRPVSLPGVAVATLAFRLPAGALSPGLPFVREVDVGGVRAFAIRVSDEPPGASWYRLLVHEVFHMHQHVVWGSLGPDERVCRYPFQDVDGLAWADVEQRALSAALHLRERPAERHEALADLLVLRTGRRASGDGGTAGVIERREERLEGTARYVELRYAEVGGHLSRDAMLAEVQRSLGPLRLMDAAKWRYYHTGAALGLLFDRLAAEGPARWTRRVDAGADLDEVLVERVPGGVDTVSRRERLAARYARAAARARLSDAVERQLAEEERWLRRFREGGGALVTIRFAGAADGYYVNRGPTIPLEDCGRLVTGIQSYVSTRYGVEVRAAVTLDGHARGRPMLIRAEDGAQTISFRAPAPDLLQIDDGAPPAAAAWDLPIERSLTATHGEWQIRFAGTGRIERGADGALTIELAEPVAADRTAAAEGSPPPAGPGALRPSRRALPRLPAGLTEEATGPR